MAYYSVLAAHDASIKKGENWFKNDLNKAEEYLKQDIHTFLNADCDRHSYLERLHNKFIGQNAQESSLARLAYLAEHEKNIEEGLSWLSGIEGKIVREWEKLKDIDKDQYLKNSKSNVVKTISASDDKLLQKCKFLVAYEDAIKEGQNQFRDVKKEFSKDAREIKDPIELQKQMENAFIEAFRKKESPVARLAFLAMLRKELKEPPGMASQLETNLIDELTRVYTNLPSGMQNSTGLRMVSESTEQHYIMTHENTESSSKVSDYEIFVDDDQTVILLVLC